MRHDPLILIGLFLIIACTTLFLYIQKNIKKSSITKTVVNTSQDNNQLKERECDLTLFDESGRIILESKEISEIPTKACKLNSSNGAYNQVTHLTADLFKGAVGIPNKTVKIVFNPKIQKGLSDGTYTLMKTKTGEVLADALNSKKRIIGKGRVIQGGKVQQLAGGAFQLVSIAVAQSHLADIERSLSSIKDSISEVLSKLENEDKAKITGAFDYLNEIAVEIKNFRSPDDISQQKKNTIESIIKDFYIWRNKLNADINSLTEQISNLKDLDTFGTGDTYEKLLEFVKKIEPLLKRHKLLLDLAIAINLVTAYIDPTQRIFSKINPDSHNWNLLMENFKSVAIDKASNNLSKSIFNRKKTLNLRNKKIISASSEFFIRAFEQQKQYETLTYRIDNNIKNMIHSDGKMCVAIKFDNCGEIYEMALV